MTRTEVEQTSRDLMAPRMGVEKTGQLIEKLLTLETVKDVRQLRPLLQRGA